MLTHFSSPSSRSPLVATYKHLSSLMDAQRARFSNTERSLKKAFKDLAKASEEDFVELLSGTIPYSVLHKLRPYRRLQSGRRAHYNRRMAEELTGNVSVPRLPINKHSEKLLEGITLGAISDTEFELYSKAKHAKWILDPDGTKFMISRGLMSGKTATGSAKRGS